MTGGGKQINRSQSVLLMPKQPLSQADTASARRSKHRQRSQEVKRAIKDKGDRCDAEKTAKRGLWETDVLALAPETSSDGDGCSAAETPYRQGGDGGCNPRRFSSKHATSDWFLPRGGEGIQSRIKKQASLETTYL